MLYLPPTYLAGLEVSCMFHTYKVWTYFTYGTICTAITSFYFRQQGEREWTLGSVMASDGRMDAEINVRLANASKAFGTLCRAVFKDKCLSIITKSKVYIPGLCALCATLRCRELEIITYKVLSSWYNDIQTKYKYK